MRQPAPEPAPWERDLVLPGQPPLCVRRLRAGDDAGLAGLYDHMSDASVYARFFSPVPRSTAVRYEHPTSTDEEQSLALVATDGGEIVAVARYQRVGRTEADVSFAVRDEAQGHGLGTALLVRLAEVARAHGIRTFVAETLPDNRRMIGAFHDAGFPNERHFEDGIIRIRADIAPGVAGEALRAAGQAPEAEGEAPAPPRR